MIKHYSFGTIVISSNRYSSDVILFGDIVRDNWWRNTGHELCVADIQPAIEEFNPAVVVVGTGKFGLMKILKETESFLKDHQIRLIAQKTKIACKFYNELLATEKVLGLFHLTC